MKNISVHQIVSFVALVVALVALGCNCFCKKNTPKIAYLNNVNVVAQANVFRQIDSETMKYVNAMQSRRAEDEKMLQVELATLRQKVKDSKEGEKAFQKEIEAFQKKAAMYNEKYREQQDSINRARDIARQQVRPFIAETLIELASKGYSIIIPQSNINYGDPDLDITQEYVKRLNEKDILVSFPDPASLMKQTANQQEKTKEEKTKSNKNK